MKLLGILFVMVLGTLGCNKQNGNPDTRRARPDTSMESSAIAADPQSAALVNTAPAKAGSTMADFVAILLDENYRTLRWGSLDSLRQAFPVLSFPSPDSIVPEGGMSAFHFGTQTGETRRLDLVLSYAAPMKPKSAVLVSGQAMDCLDGRKTFGPTHAKLIEKLGPPKGAEWEAGAYLVSLSPASPDTSCYALSIDARQLYEGDHD